MLVTAVHSAKSGIEAGIAAFSAFRNGDFWDGLAYAALAAANGTSTALSLIGVKTALTPPPWGSGLALATAGTGGGQAIVVWEILAANPAVMQWVLRTVAPVVFKGFLLASSVPIQDHHKIPHDNKSYDFQNHSLVRRAGVDLFTDERNLMLLANHRGRHAKPYLDAIRLRLNTAWSRLKDRVGKSPSKSAADKQFAKVVNKIENDIASGTLKPYKSKDVWIP